jgi:hypothetical protein
LDASYINKNDQQVLNAVNSLLQSIINQLKSYGLQSNNLQNTSVSNRSKHNKSIETKSEVIDILIKQLNQYLDQFCTSLELNNELLFKKGLQEIKELKSNVSKLQHEKSELQKGKENSLNELQSSQWEFYDKMNNKYFIPLYEASQIVDDAERNKRIFENLIQISFHFISYYNKNIIKDYREYDDINIKLVYDENTAPQNSISVNSSTKNLDNITAAIIKLMRQCKIADLGGVVIQGNKIGNN